MHPREPDELFQCGHHGDALPYSANKLSCDGKLEFEAHLRECLACRSEVDQVRADLQALRGSIAAVEADFDPTLAARTLKRMRQARSQSRKLVVSLCVAGILAGFIAFLATSTPVTLSPWSRQEPTPAVAAHETPLDRALAWLRSTQEPEGGWNPERWGGASELKVGVSGLIVLALERAGAADTEATMDRAISFLLREQRPTGRFGPEFSGTLYNHSIATLALLEAHARSRDETRRSSIDRALSYLISQQSPRGGWGTGAQIPRDGGAMSIWPVEALARARELGWDRLAKPLEWSFRWMDSVAVQAAYGSSSEVALDPAATPLYRAAAALLRDGDQAHSRSARQAFDGLVKALATRSSGADAHRSYFLSRLAGSGVSDRLREPVEAARRAIERRQVAVGPLAGSWEPSDPVSGAGGRLSSTALAALTLEAAGRLR